MSLLYLGVMERVSQVRHQSNAYYVRDISFCPYCHNHIAANYQSSFFEINKESDALLDLITIWQCPNPECFKYIFAKYVAHRHVNGDQAEFVGFLDGTPELDKWPKVIVELNSRFIKIYEQSLIAEFKGLDEIAGMGFRKAIEFLVKDWAIKEKPEDRDKIISFTLNEVVNSYFKDELKAILLRATWLGNDQSHYQKLFEEYDVSDLKELIGLIISDLDKQERTKHWINSVESRKNKPSK